jgi:acyl phosphate:glycerol-3-phosphate acyltransferase
MFFLYLIGAYIIGSIPFGLIIAFLGYDVDVRTQGSGNIGMTNVKRTVGTKAAMLTLIGDVGKGWMLICFSPEKSPTDLLFVGMAVLLGHCYSIFLQGKGGKGVATALGVMLSVSTGVALISLGVWASVRFAFKKSSLAALITMGTLLPATLLLSPEHWVLACFTIGLVVWRHRDNIERLKNGGE